MDSIVSQVARGFMPFVVAALPTRPSILSRRYLRPRVKSQIATR